VILGGTLSVNAWRGVYKTSREIRHPTTETNNPGRAIEALDAFGVVVGEVILLGADVTAEATDGVIVVWAEVVAALVRASTAARTKIAAKM